MNRNTEDKKIIIKWTYSKLILEARNNLGLMLLMFQTTRQFILRLVQIQQKFLRNDNRNMR